MKHQQFLGYEYVIGKYSHCAINNLYMNNLNHTYLNVIPCEGMTGDKGTS